MHEFSIASGQETALTLDLQSGSPVVLTFRVELSLIEPGGIVDLQVFDGTGQLFSRESLGFLKDHFRHNGDYPPGSYTFKASYGDSLRSDGEFEIEADSVGATTLSFILR